jgi:hypothetical protein
VKKQINKQSAILQMMAKKFEIEVETEESEDEYSKEKDNDELFLSYLNNTQMNKLIETSSLSQASRRKFSRSISKGSKSNLIETITSS